MMFKQTLKLNTKLNKIVLSFAALFLFVIPVDPKANAAEDLQRALKRAQYLLTGTYPTDAEYSSYSSSKEAYNVAVRSFLNHPNLYYTMLRYHERVLGVGLSTEYLEELLDEDIDNTSNKVARIRCAESGSRMNCYWASADEGSKVSSCPSSWMVATGIFWYPGVVAWVCPTVLRSCGADLANCFIEFEDEALASNAELGSTAAFDTRSAVIKSLSKQSAGLATAIVLGNYPYTQILEPGVTAVDGAIAHFLKQSHHFDLEKLNLNPELVNIINSVPLTETKFRLAYTGHSYEQGGIISTFGWLRRYDKNRTRANQLYERLLCKKFTSELPTVFPQDPGNLREAPGCSGCHATLDPLADFFLSWGEGSELYAGEQNTVTTSFGGQSGSYLSDLADIVRNDNAFSTCTVQNVWEFLMGRGFYDAEADLRAALTTYFVTTNFDFKELMYAITTHSAFLEGNRSDAEVASPLTEPPLGEIPGGSELPDCATYGTVSYATDIAPNSVTYCNSCHGAASGRSDLTSLAGWAAAKASAEGVIASGNMPPGSSGPPFSGSLYDFKERVRCWDGVTP
jgi:hypothetical protein